MNKLIIAAGVILVILIIVTIFISSSKKNQTSQEFPTLIPTTIFENGGGAASGKKLSEQEVQQLEQKVADINSHVFSTDQANRYDEVKSKLPVSNNDFAIGYSEALGQFFVQKKTAQADAALQKFFQDNNFLDVYQQFPDLFVTTNQPVDQAILQAEQNLANIKNEFYQQQQLQQQNQQSQQNIQKKQNKEDLGQQQFINLMQTFFSIDTTSDDLQELNKILKITPTSPSGITGNNGGGTRGGTFIDNGISQALMDIFNEAGNKVGIDPKLLAAIMRQECPTVLYWPQSQIVNHPTLKFGDPCYTSYTGDTAYGPMQFTPGTWTSWAPRVKDMLGHQPNYQNIRDAIFAAAFKLKAAAQAKDPFNLTQQEVFKAASAYRGGCTTNTYCQDVWDYYSSHGGNSSGTNNSPQSGNDSGRTVGKTTVPKNGTLNHIQISAAAVIARYGTSPKANSVDWTWVTEATAVGLAESGGYCCSGRTDTNSWGLWQVDAGNARMNVSNTALYDPILNAQAMWSIQGREVSMSQSRYGTNWGAYWSTGRPGAARFFKNAEFYSPAQQAANKLTNQLQ